ncbi:hypothetical protein ABG067_000854 [Albugo candida]
MQSSRRVGTGQRGAKSSVQWQSRALALDGIKYGALDDIRKRPPAVFRGDAVEYSAYILNCGWHHRRAQPRDQGLSSIYNQGQRLIVTQQVTNIQTLSDFQNEQLELSVQREYQNENSQADLHIPHEDIGDGANKKRGKGKLKKWMRDPYSTRGSTKQPKQEGMSTKIDVASVLTSIRA